MRLTSLIRELRLDLAALLWPTACVGCSTSDRECCDRCVARLRARADGSLAELHGVPVFCCGRYAGVLRALLIAFKHEGRVGFAKLLGEQMRSPLLAALALAAAEVPDAAPLIVTLPSRPAGVRRRGYRHVDLLVASALRGRRHGAFRVRALRTTRGRVGQVGLRAAERERNARRIAVRRSAAALVRGRSVVLVDDILTTGASMRAAHDALAHAGATVVAMVVLCAAERLDHSADPANLSAKS